MSLEDAELLKEFVVESQEHLSDVENQLLTLESQGESMDVTLVNTVFRAVHSIKGAAGFLGLDTLQGLAHREEEVLNKLRNHELRPTSVVINTLLKATDRLKGLLDEVDDSNGQDVSEHLVALERILNSEAESTASSPVNVAAPVSINGLSGEALREFLVESYDNLEQLERDLISLERNSGVSEIINSAFRNIHTIKGNAGFLGFSKLEKVTHVAENLLGCIRSGKMDVNAEISGGLFKMVDAVRLIVSSIERQKNEGDDNIDSLVAHLIALGEESPSNSPEEKIKAKASAKKRTSKKTNSDSHSPSGPVVATPTKAAAKSKSTPTAHAATNEVVFVEPDSVEVPAPKEPTLETPSAVTKPETPKPAIANPAASSTAACELVSSPASSQKAAKSDSDVSAADTNEGSTSTIEFLLHARPVVASSSRRILCSNTQL